MYLSKQAHFIFYTQSKAENQLKFKQYNGTSTCVWTLKLLRRSMQDFIIAPNLWLLNISDFNPVDYRILTMLQSESVNILCETFISCGNIWLKDRRSLIKPLIGGDLGWVHELWPEVDIWTFNIVQCFIIALHCWSIRFHTLCDVLFKHWRR